MDVEDQLKDSFIKSVKEFYTNEQHLIKDDLCERALVFRLGLIMSRNFHEYSVYSEYNRAHDAEDHSGYKEIQGQIYTYPDIIVVSGEQGAAANMLVVEAKKMKNNDIRTDLEKLFWFTSGSYTYRYKVGAHLFFLENCFIVVFYMNGRPNSLQKYTLTESLWEDISVDLNDYYYYSSIDVLLEELTSREGQDE